MRQVSYDPVEDASHLILPTAIAVAIAFVSLCVGVVWQVQKRARQMELKGQPFATQRQILAVALGFVSSDLHGVATSTMPLPRRSSLYPWQANVAAFAADHPLAVVTASNHLVLGVLAAHAVASHCALLGSLHMYTHIVGVRRLAVVPTDAPLSVRTTLRTVAPHRRGVLVAIRRDVHLARLADEPLATITDVLLLRAAPSLRALVAESTGTTWLGLDVVDADLILPRLPPVPTETVPCSPLLLDPAWGSRYATLSGDHNPIHLYGAAAWLAGLGSRPIAHGMSVVRAVWASTVPATVDTAHAWFTKPVPFPAPSVPVARAPDTTDYFVAGKSVVLRVA